MRKLGLWFFAFFAVFLSVNGALAATFYDVPTQTLGSSGSFAQCIWYRYNATETVTIFGISKLAASTPTRAFFYNGSNGADSSNCVTGNASYIASCTFSGNNCIFDNNITKTVGTNWTIAMDNAGAAWTQYYGTAGQLPAYGNTSKVRWLGAYSNGGGAGGLDGTPRSITGIYFVTSSGPGPNVVTASLTNVVNGSSWPGSVTFSNVTGTLTFTYFNITGAGYCVSYTGNGTGTNCTASGSGSSTFFNVTNASVSITGTQGVTAAAYQSILSINATMLYSLSPVGSFNVTNGLVLNTTSAGVLTIAGLAGSNNVALAVAGNYTVNETCTGVALSVSSCTVAGVYDDRFKINATDSINGAPVLNFTVQVSNSSLGGNIVNMTTTNGSVFIPLLQGYSYFFSLDAAGYAYQNTTQSANASTNLYSFALLPSNSLFLFFYDQTTLDPIDYENVTVVFSNGTSSFQNKSMTGEMIASNLAVGTWTITASAPSYESAQYFVTVTARSSQDLDVYLFNSTLTGETTITIKDANTADVIQGATVTLQIEIAGNWVTFDQQVSDIFGVTFFDLEQGEEYQMIVEAPGYSTKTGTFVRTTSSYIVPLLSANTQDFTSFLDDFTFVTSPEYVGLNSTTFSITTSSPDGRLEWFSVSVLVNGTVTTSNVTGSPSGGTASVTLNLSSFPGHTVVAIYRVKSTSFDDPLEVSRSWYISGLVGGNYTFTSFMEYYAEDENGLGFGARGIMLTVVAVLMALAVGSFFGLEAGAVIAAFVFLAGSFYGWLHWSVTIVIVCGIVGILLMKGGRL